MRTTTAHYSFSSANTCQEQIARYERTATRLLKLKQKPDAKRGPRANLLMRIYAVAANVLFATGQSTSRTSSGEGGRLIPRHLAVDLLDIVRSVRHNRELEIRGSAQESMNEALEALADKHEEAIAYGTAARDSIVPRLARDQDQAMQALRALHAQDRIQWQTNAERV
jgi:hypothetical protein